MPLQVVLAQFIEGGEFSRHVRKIREVSRVRREMVMEIPAKQLDDLRSPLRFLLGHTQLKKELDNLTVTSEGSGYRISGVPKGMEQRVTLLSLWVTAAGAIERMRLEEVDGAVTEFVFSDMKENVLVKDSDFGFVPPAGVTVVQGLPPI